VKTHLKLLLAVVLIIIVTYVVTSYFAVKNTRATFFSVTLDVEAFNELHRIRSWDNLEQLLIKGCNKEALEYVRGEQYSGLVHLEDKLKNGARLDKQLIAENPSILIRANSITNKSRHFPTCN
jgi:hypothetical protein